MGNQLLLLGLRSKAPSVPYEGDPEILAEMAFSGFSPEELYLALNPPFRILDLPEELLNEIVALACSDYMSPAKGMFVPRQSTYKAALSLSRVCKTFYRLATPILYSSLKYWERRYDTASLRTPHQLLYQTLQSKPSLARCCKELELELHDYNRPDEESESDESPSIKECRCSNQHIHGCGWKVVQSTLALLPRVESLGLRFTYTPEYTAPGSLCLQSLCEVLTPLRQLKKLKLGNFYRGSKFPKEFEGSAAFTSIELRHVNRDFEEFAAFLTWPARLEHVTLTGTFFWPEDAICPIDVSDFRNLETLWLHTRNMIAQWTAEDVCRNILSAPRLRKLGWDGWQEVDYEGGQEMDDQGYPHLPCLDSRPEQAQWLSRVVSLASADNSALREVEILLWPYGKGRSRKTEAEAYLELLDPVKSEMAALGMRLVCQMYALPGLW
ncbi:hypothetical protein BU16DRAFT_617323 [Lophium mytilinum]|uniref:F-box domain-containing protein n=1 Tax=Lophium mytilinum TaxID=390894 RepID=A0A6A6QUG5_9PEZI|nr:hypothetical protein BU16DRAFT_617323 [Lophium mytilinum]